jgi:hypothetical protein
MHITEFLEKAAPSPTRAVDITKVMTDAQRSPWYKRRWVWVAGVIAVGGATVPAGIALAPASSPGTRVISVQPHPGTPTGTPGRVDDSSGNVAAGAAAGGGVNASRDAEDVSGQGVPSTLPTPPATTLPPGSSSSADECIVTGGDYGVDAPPYGGAGLGGYPTCDYTAATPAGYTAYAASWEIDITKRDGTRITLGPGPVVANPAASCGVVGTIEPGDRVHVVLYTGAENAASVQSVKVGRDHHC